jgi:hypothetical protein
MTAAAFDSRATSRLSSVRSSNAALWTGRVLTGIAALFLTFDTIVKLALVKPALDANAQLGYAASMIRPVGLIELACLVVYLVPRTAPIGALFWTGYLGGAIASQLRAGNPLFSHVLFPIYVAALVWGGLWLRDARVRSLVRPRADV